MSNTATATATKSATNRGYTVLLSQIEGTIAQLASKQAEARKIRRQLNSVNRVKNRAQRIRNYALAQNGVFTTRMVATAVFHEKSKISVYDTSQVGVTLRKMVKNGELYRFPALGSDVKNNGQLLYSRGR